MRRASLQRGRGFTLVEVLVVTTLMGALVGIAIVNYTHISTSSSDTIAEHDYRNIRVALEGALLEPETPDRFVIRRFLGPGVLPSPLQSVSISPEVDVSLFHQTRVRRNRTPRTTTRLTVFHREGLYSYRYIERNGEITEQIVDRR